LEGIEKVYTFALAFRKYTGKQHKESLCKSNAMKLASIAETQPNLLEFFEKIYINREVVQEASRTHYYI